MKTRTLVSILILILAILMIILYKQGLRRRNVKKG
jgi:hypothetical protein